MVLERHPKKFKHFVKIMLTHLVEHENITTTQAKAKHLKPYAQKLLRFAKKAEAGRTSPLNLLKGRIHTKKAEKKLLVDLMPRIKHTKGGFIQIKNLEQTRRGDGASLWEISIKGNQKSQFEKKRLQEAKKKSLLPDKKEFQAKILQEQKEFMEKKIKQSPEMELFFKQKIEEVSFRQWELQRDPKQPPKYTLLI